MIASCISFSETTLYPGRELFFETFFAFDLVPFAAARFAGVGLPYILFFSALKIFYVKFSFN